MKRFDYRRANSREDALKDARAGDKAQYLAGGTTQFDLMKLGVLQPAVLTDISGFRKTAAAVQDQGGWLRLDASLTMAAVASDRVILQNMPVVAQSLAQAASPQIRAMATIGGNLLQRTRCGYYRDVSWAACNRRVPGSGCSAIAGSAPAHAVLGTSAACIAIYPGDFAQSLVALGATLELEGAQGPRLLPVGDLHRLPGREPHLETNLRAGELIAAIRVPKQPWFARSRYVKVRDRASYEFALASAAVALHLDGDRVRDARVAIGGGATVPWRSEAAETVLRGQRLDVSLAQACAAAAFASAVVREDTKARLMLGKATLVRALLEVRDMDPARG